MKRRHSTFVSDPQPWHAPEKLRTSPRVFGFPARRELGPRQDIRKFVRKAPVSGSTINIRTHLTTSTPSQETKTPTSKKPANTENDLHWDGNCPCYEIINIQFEDDDDDLSTDSADSSSSNECHRNVQYIDYFGGEYGPLADLHISSDELGKNIDFDIAAEDDKEDEGKQDRKEEQNNPLKTEPEDPEPSADQELDSAEPEWECPVCKHLSPDYAIFEIHLKGTHKVGRKCPLCRLQFASLECNLAHVTKDHMNRWACPQCQLGFGFLMEYVNHMTDSHELPDLDVDCLSGVLECSPCNLKFEDHLQLTDHYKKSHVNMACPSCDKRFQQFQPFLRHIFNEHLKCSFSCAEFDCDYERNNPISVKQHTRSTHMPPRQCPICRIIIHDPHKYGLHMSLHEDSTEGTYICDICGSTYSTPRKRDDHRKSHFHSKVKHQSPSGHKKVSTGK